MPGCLSVEDSADDVRNCWWDSLMVDVNPDSNRNLYNIWAPTYDADMADQAYRAPKLIGELVKDTLKVSATARILDVGCGTGLLGKELLGLEYTNIDGLDFSHEMLKLARKKECYESCELLKVHPKLADPPVPEGVTESYDLITFCSSIAPGHISPSCIPLFLPHMNKNAYIVFAMIYSPNKLPKTSLCEPTKFLEYINEMCQEYNLTLTSVDEVSALIKGKDGRVGVLQKTSD